MAHIAILQISTPKSNFTDGDIIPINGYALPNSTINIFLVNNYGNIQNSTQVMSNSTGYFNTSLGIPSHVIGGAWTLFAINGDSNFAMQLMVNFHGSNTPPFHSPGAFPPLKQFKLGIKPTYVQCRSDLHLIIKSEDGSPACVTDSSMGKMTRQGWWAWNNNVGNTIINNSGKKDYENKDCAIFETASAIVGTNGFVLDDLPLNGTTFYGADTSRMVGGITQFAIHPATTGQITLTYDFNHYPGSNCKVTTSDAISNVDPSRPNATVSELINSPDIMRVDENSVNTSIPSLGNSGDILLNLASVENLNDHVVKATYKIFATPDAQLGKSYYVGFWWHSAVVITIGDSLYTGHAFEGTHYG